MFYTKSERRVNSAQRRDRPELQKHGWDVLKLAKNFQLPPLDDKMERVEGTSITLEEFRRKYEAPRIPCVITGLTRNWKAHENWTIQKLLKDYPNDSFKVGEGSSGDTIFLKFKYFAEYMRENEDDSPLYIFDEYFGEGKRTKEMLKDYDVPVFFKENLFDLLGNDTKRPPYRWIVIGPARSGTNIHIDPLGTSAWNALIHGHKRWIFIHPDTPREFVTIPKSERGIHPNEAITWFSTVYKRIHQGDWPFERYPAYECRQNPGETLFVPCGWWHVVINEDDTVAVTQNFCSPVNLPYVYPTIREERPSLASAFLEKLNELRPELMQTVYESLLDPKPILDSYGSDSEKEVIGANDGYDESETTSFSTDESSDQDSGDNECDEEEAEETEETEDEQEEKGGEKEESDEEEEEEEESDSQEAVVKSGFVDIAEDSEDEGGFCESGDSEDSETYSDYDTDDDDDDDVSERSSPSPEIHTEPVRAITPILTASEGGLKRRAVTSPNRRLGIPIFLNSTPRSFNN
ncbi:JmjC domain protein [Necator americanus]|uniref:JmjC domain protein n=1 Tax=Necator americanus TaxID=51031 RepID=W2T1K8_NECAM|nr:JmjC domain protein [Necator americanus]ETN75454.1 JmjC domain protein [Necator americanus]